MFYQSHSLALHTVEIFCNLILRNVGLGLEKILELLEWHGLVSWYIGVILEKYLDYLGFGLISWYIGVVLEKHLD